ncbi:MAG: molybdopterin-binding protein [Ignavibacteriaceae bacterium]|nr:molybdopterin-binding protein [Ignavibacteriaceae bacterium]
MKVYRKIKFGVFSTGDELIDIDGKVTEDKIRGTNLYSVISLLNECNMETLNFGFVKDDKAKIREKLADAFNSDIDILVTTGGVSVGKYDYLKELLIEFGTEVKFWKVNIKPGKPIVFGIWEKKTRRNWFLDFPEIRFHLM